MMPPEVLSHVMSFMISDSDRTIILLEAKAGIVGLDHEMVFRITCSRPWFVQALFKVNRAMREEPLRRLPLWFPYTPGTPGIYCHPKDLISLYNPPSWFKLWEQSTRNKHELKEEYMDYEQDEEGERLSKRLVCLWRVHGGSFWEEVQRIILPSSVMELWAKKYWRAQILRDLPELKVLNLLLQCGPSDQPLKIMRPEDNPHPHPYVLLAETDKNSGEVVAIHSSLTKSPIDPDPKSTQALFSRYLVELNAQRAELESWLERQPRDPKYEDASWMFPKIKLLGAANWGREIKKLI